MQKDKLPVLAYDLSDSVKSIELWLQKREKKSEIYYAIGEYIKILEQISKFEEFNYSIKKQIKRLQKEQKKYYVEPLLGVCLSERKIDTLLSDDQKKHSLEIASKVYNKSKGK